MNDNREIFLFVCIWNIVSETDRFVFVHFVGSVFSAFNLSLHINQTLKCQTQGLRKSDPWISQLRIKSWVHGFLKLKQDLLKPFQTPCTRPG